MNKQPRRAAQPKVSSELQRRRERVLQEAIAAIEACKPKEN